MGNVQHKKKCTNDVNYLRCEKLGGVTGEEHGKLLWSTWRGTREERRKPLEELRNAQPAGGKTSENSEAWKHAGMYHSEPLLPFTPVISQTVRDHTPVMPMACPHCGRQCQGSGVIAKWKMVNKGSSSSLAFIGPPRENRRPIHAQSSRKQRKKKISKLKMEYILRGNVHGLLSSEEKADQMRTVMSEMWQKTSCDSQ